MKNKRDLMGKLCFAGCIFGYFCFERMPVIFRFAFMVFAALVIIVYIAECVKNRYGKVSIIASILSLMVFGVLMIDQIIMYKYPELLVYRGYVLLAGMIIVLTLLIVAAINYIRTASKREGIFMKILLLIIGILILLLIALIVL